MSEQCLSKCKLCPDSVQGKGQVGFKRLVGLDRMDRMDQIDGMDRMDGMDGSFTYQSTLQKKLGYIFPAKKFSIFKIVIFDFFDKVILQKAH